MMAALWLTGGFANVCFAEYLADRRRKSYGDGLFADAWFYRFTGYVTMAAAVVLFGVDFYQR